MKVAVNTRLLLAGRLEGIGWFTHEVLRRLVLAYPRHEFLFMFDRAYDPQFVYAPNVTPVVLHPQARAPLLWRIWFEWSVPRALKRHRADVFFSPDGYLSLSATARQVAVMHDLNFEHNPQDLVAHHTRYLKKWFPQFARRADHLITVSEFSRHDIHQRYGVPLDRISVAYNGVNTAYSPASATEVQAVRDQYTQGHPYLLCVGAVHPRKNIVRMLRAFDAHLASTGSPLRLVFAGNRTWWTPEMETAYRSMTNTDRVVFLGRVPQDALNRIVPSAFALLYASTFEGFGMPIVEAFRAGVPVITSNVTSMPEIAADAALLCDPMDERSIRSSILTMETDDALRARLIEKGLVRGAVFSWDDTVAHVAKVLGL
jgi:glycosyltransferase involved in cell wall biosynthesis